MLPVFEDVKELAVGVRSAVAFSPRFFAYLGHLEVKEVQLVGVLGKLELVQENVTLTPHRPVVRGLRYAAGVEP